VHHVHGEQIKALLVAVDVVFGTFPAAILNYFLEGSLVRLPKAIVVGIALFSLSIVIFEETCFLIAFMLVVAKEVNPLFHFLCDKLLLSSSVAIVTLVELTWVSLESVSGSCAISHCLELFNSATSVGTLQ
jgi:hypothetical protein